VLIVHVLFNNVERTVMLKCKKRFFAISTFILVFSGVFLRISSAEDIRQPAVAGAFYPKDADVLRADVQKYLDNAKAKPVNGKIIGIQVPHAGYQFSAQTAAYAYRQVAKQKYDLVVVIAPSHRDPFYGATLYPGDGYATPLGTLYIDKSTAQRLAKDCDVVKFSELGHRAEHAVEVELPFVQILFPDVKILPIVVGGYDWPLCEKIGKALAKVVAGKKVLLIASSDLYHGYSYETCKKVSAATLAAATDLNPKKLCEGLLQEKYSACGGAPIVIMETAARLLGANKAKLLAHTNSGDVTGKRDGYIVGYGAVAVFASKKQAGDHVEYEPLPPDVQKEFLRMARSSIEQYLLKRKLPRFKPTCDAMKEKRGVFVTITENGMLRGCIGHHESDEPLYKLVPQMALAAAFQDPRFPPLDKSELKKIKIKISVYLTNVYKINSLDEFKMGEMGIIMKKNGHAATYLPEVPTEAGWTSIEEEMRNLCRKAGLGQDAWKKGAEFWVYRTQVFDESIL